MVYIGVLPASKALINELNPAVAIDIYPANLATDPNTLPKPAPTLVRLFLNLSKPEIASFTLP
jgi:hypothetical protein